MKNNQKGIGVIGFLIVVLVIITAGFIIYVVGKNSNSINTANSNLFSEYPMSVYKILSSAEKQQRMQSFIAKNGPFGPLCSVRTVNSSIIDYREFDQLGFIGGVSCSLLNPNYPQSDWNFTDADIGEVNQFKSENTVFFGIDNLNNFNLVPATDGNSYYKADQNITGYKLDNLISFQKTSQFSVGKMGKYVSFSGHFYPNATLPASPKFSIQEITNRFVGKDYSYPENPCIDNFFGTCHPKALTIKLAPSNLKTKLIAFLYQKNQTTIELRLVYTVQIKAPYIGSSGYHEETKIIDAITGENLFHYK